MTESKGLEHYYGGNEAWNHFAALGIDEWKNCPFQDELLDAVDGALDLAMVIYHEFDKHYDEWIENPVPALGDMSPKECLKTDWGVKRLRECLMRMP